MVRQDPAGTDLDGDSASPSLQQGDHLALDVPAGRGPDKGVGELSVVIRQDRRPVLAVVSSTHRAKRKAVRLLPSANAWARLTLKARTAAAVTASWASSMDASARSTLARSSRSPNHSSSVRTAALNAMASPRDGRLNGRGDTRAARGTQPADRQARRGRRRPSAPRPFGQRLARPGSQLKGTRLGDHPSVRGRHEAMGTYYPGGLRCCQPTATVDSFLHRMEP